MDGYQSFGSPLAAPSPSVEHDGVCQLLSPITSDETNESSFEEGDSNDSSGFHTGSDPASEELDPLDRVAATREILTILNQYPEISIELLDWASRPLLRARIFIDEEPQMLTRSSTIVEAHPDREKAHAEFYRGVSAICRIISDERMKIVRDWAIQLEGEWRDALAKGNEDVRYGEYIDLMYSEAERVVEKGQGAYRENGDMEVVGEVFGFARKEIGEELGEQDVNGKAEHAMDTEV